LISRRIHHGDTLENFLASAGRHTTYKKVDKNLDPLMIANSKTTTISHVPGQKNPWPPVPRNEMPLQEYPMKYAAEG